MGPIKTESSGRFERRSPRQRRANLIRAARNPSATYFQLLSDDLLFQQKSEEAIAAAQKSVALDPSDSWGFEAMSWALTLNGRPRDGKDFLDAT